MSDFDLDDFGVPCAHDRIKADTDKTVLMACCLNPSCGRLFAISTGRNEWPADCVAAAEWKCADTRGSAGVRMVLAGVRWCMGEISR